MSYCCAPFYDIRTAVGKNSPNEQTDVMLVQYFLFHIMVDRSWSTRFPSPILGLTPDPIFPINGQFKPGLVDWIQVFQQAANQQGLGPLVVDGVISHGGAAWGKRKPRAGKWYAIHVMNDILHKADCKRYYTLVSDSSVPGPLKKALGFVVNIDLAP